MTNSTPTVKSGTLFGVPVGELGWFASLLMGTASGFVVFFAATFLGIVTILIVNAGGHQVVDYSMSYRLIGLPAGLLMLVVAYVYLGTLWTKRLLRKS